VAKKDPTPPVDARPVEPAPNTYALLHGRIVDVKTGAVLHVLREKKPRVEAMDDKGAFTVDADGVLRAWNVASGKLQWEHPSKVCDRVLVDGERVVTADGGDVEIVNRRDGSVAASIAGAPHFGDVRLVSDRIVIGGSTISNVDMLTAKPSAGRTIAAPVESVIEDPRLGLAVRTGEVCYAMFDPPNHRIECVDLAVKLVRSAVVLLARPTDVSGTRFHTRFISSHHIVIGTWSFGGFKSTRRSAVVRLSDGAVTVIEDEVAAAVERPDGTLEGLLVMTPEVKLLSPSGAVRWTYKKMPRTEEFAAVTLIEDRLVIAGFNAIATGVQVFALNVNDGRELWKGETKLPPIAHSKYHNTVTIEALGDAAIVRGNESAVKHVHVYDSKTGALRFSDAQ